MSKCTQLLCFVGDPLSCSVVLTFPGSQAAVGVRLKVVEREGHVGRPECIYGNSRGTKYCEAHLSAAAETKPSYRKRLRVRSLQRQVLIRYHRCNTDSSSARICQDSASTSPVLTARSTFQNQNQNLTTPMIPHCSVMSSNYVSYFVLIPQTEPLIPDLVQM